MKSDYASLSIELSSKSSSKWEGKARQQEASAIKERNYILNLVFLNLVFRLYRMYHKMPKKASDTITTGLIPVYESRSMWNLRRMKSVTEQLGVTTDKLDETMMIQ